MPSIDDHDREIEEEESLNSFVMHFISYHVMLAWSFDERNGVDDKNFTWNIIFERESNHTESSTWAVCYWQFPCHQIIAASNHDGMETFQRKWVCNKETLKCNKQWSSHRSLISTQVQFSPLRFQGILEKVSKSWSSTLKSASTTCEPWEVTFLLSFSLLSPEKSKTDDDGRWNNMTDRKREKLVNWLCLIAFHVCFSCLKFFFLSSQHLSFCEKILDQEKVMKCIPT